MAHFTIEMVEPWECKDSITRFWLENIPGTPIERFDWLAMGNPAGPASWFLAFESKSREVAGTISILPKDLKVAGKTVRAGILGDFMVDQKYRVLGPGLGLLKKAMNSIAELNLEFIYTIPNRQSEKMIRHMGFIEVGKICYLAKPISIHYYLDKYAEYLPSRITGSLIELGIKALSRETYYPSAGIIEEVGAIDEAFDEISDVYAERTCKMTGVRSKEYLTWRYLKNPQYVFRIAVLKDHHGRTRGYAVYMSGDDYIEIYDIIAQENVVVQNLMKYLAQVARDADCKSIYITVGPMNPLAGTLKWNLFFDTKFDMRLYAFGNDELMRKEWCFFASDRNI